MKFLKKLIFKWVEEENENKYSKGVSAVRVDDSRIDDEPVLNFRIYSANNGRIIEFNKYDRVKDKTNRSLYIIDKEQDIGEYVGKVLSLELLK